MIKLILMSLLLADALLPLQLNAEILYVFPEDRIQSAVEFAAQHDTIIVHEGAYEESVVFYGKKLTLSSLFLLDGDFSHISNTQITGTHDRPDTSSALVFAYGEDSARVVGLTISGTGGTLGGTEDLENFGGGIYVYVSFPTIEHCTIQQSESYYGGGLAVEGNWNCVATGCRLLDCNFTDCNAIGGSGAIWARSCSLSVKRCVFEYDSSVFSCSGLRVTDSCILIDSCRFVFCDAGSGGALLAAHNMGIITRCLFENNSTHYQAGFCDLDFFDNSVIVSNCLFRNNATPNHSIQWRAGGFTARFTGNVVENMTTDQLSATMGLNDGPGDVGYNIFRNNSNIAGGAVHGLLDSRARVHHNVFTGNVSVNRSRGSAVTTFSRSLRVDSNMFIGNLGAAVSIGNDFALLDARNNFWGDPSGPYHPTQNPSGRGDTLLSDSVLFIPWLTEPPDTTLPEATDENARAPIASTWQILELFPNPFNSEIRIVIAGFTRADFSLRLYNLQGREISVLHRGPLTGGHLSFTAPADLASGVYFVVASDHEFAEARKAVLLK